MALRLLADLVPTDAKMKSLEKELAAAARASGSHGIGPAGAARILADVGDVVGFPDRNHFASWTGTAPLDASSGEQIRHRHSRAETGGSIPCSTSPPLARFGYPVKAAPAPGGSWRKRRRRRGHCAA